MYSADHPAPTITGKPMKLHDFDDLPFHQHPAPFHMLATSDSHFNDGYFFATYAPGWYILSGLRLHPNTNTLDGFAGVAHNGEQRCVRFSRALHPGYGDLSVGLFRLEITDPMERQHLALKATDAGFDFDLMWQAQAPAFVESRYQHLKYGRIINDVIRYTQVCRTTGTAHFDGEELQVDSWFAMRDHSWGIRSSMGPPTRIGGVDPASARGDVRAFRLWVPFEAGDHCGFFHTHEDQAGKPIDFEGRLHFQDGKSVELVSVDHTIDYEKGLPVGGSFELLDVNGVRRRYEVRSSGSPADVQGLGYYGGWYDRGSAGVYRGAETVEIDRYPVGGDNGRSGPEHIPGPKRLGPTEFPVFITGPDGGQGMAHFEHTIIGAAGVSGAARPGDAAATPSRS
jgi:hypothetical protein